MAHGTVGADRHAVAADQAGLIAAGDQLREAFSILEPDNAHGALAGADPVPPAFAFVYFQDAHLRFLLSMFGF
jgi:hypothetical protein